KRYDCDRIFSAAGDDRHQLILMMVLDIAVYHIFCIHNPQKLSQVRKDRYERAVEWMRAVSREDISIEGAPMLPEEERSSGASFRIRSNHKRVCHM
ncbi:phage protein Gp36 family protein, partial [Duncaniella freteri]